MQFRTFALLAFLFAAVTLFAQIPVPPPEPHDFVFFNHAVTMHATEPGEVSEDLIRAARAALNLSDVQINAMKALLKMRQQSTEQIMQSVHERQKKLEDLVGQKNPNPTDVGTAFLAARAAHEQVQAAHEKFRTDFNALLNATQRAAIDKLKTASEQLGSLMELGILEGGLHHAFGMPFPGSEAGFAIGIEPRLSNDR